MVFRCRLSAVRSLRPSAYETCPPLIHGRPIAPTRDATPQAACTFQPKTGRAPSPALHGGRSRVPAPERLYREAEQKEQALAMARRRIEEAERAQCTFQPQISPPPPQSSAVGGNGNGNQQSPGDGDPSGRKPIHERVADILRKRSSELAQAR